MPSLQPVLAGAMIGLTVAAPIGPMAVIVIHRTLASGVSAGLATGAGASTIHLVYALLAILGLDQLSGALTVYRAELRVFTALLLLFLAIRTLRRFARPVRTTRPAQRSLLVNYASAIAFNGLNPLGFVLLMGAVGAMTNFARQGGTSAYQLAVGVFVGSIGWWLVLVAATAIIGLRLSPRRTKFIDLAAASMLLLLAVSMIARLF